MEQHQLRGSVDILDDCTFQVTRFDMLPGRDVYWWGAASDALEDLLAGTPVADAALEGKYDHSTFEVTLANGVTWDSIGLLGVWSRATASDYGHILLQVVESAEAPSAAPQRRRKGDLGRPLFGAGSPSPAPAPGVAPQPSSALDGLGSHSGKHGVKQWTMFRSCKKLSATYRVRWTLDAEAGVVELGLEAIVLPSQYLAFGWANPAGDVKQPMVGADVTVVGFKNESAPFSEDYFLESKDTCSWDPMDPAGVCPDVFLADGLQNASNVELVHGQRLDGVMLVRYQRMLASPDRRFDHDIQPDIRMQVIWALGALHMPDDEIPHVQPTFHGAAEGTTYGSTELLLGEPYDDCQGPLEALNLDVGSPVVPVDRGATLPVTAAATTHYPNPPSNARSLHIKGIESPILKVERGVPVDFSIQAGHDVPFYVTSDPVGGARNSSETVFAGGETAHGVPTAPCYLTWTPNSSTPNLVYYQSYSEPKMGWKVQVVDGGLTDMYQNHTMLADDQVTLFWTLTEEQIAFAVRGSQPSGWLAIALGRGMVDSYAYVGWIEDGVGKVGTYYIDGKHAYAVHKTEEELLMAKCDQSSGIITFEFSRLLRPDPKVCGDQCGVTINPESDLKVVWAYGLDWTSGTLTHENKHMQASSSVTLVDLRTGEAMVEHLQPVFVVHGFMMFIAWGLLLPFGMLAARYIKKGDWLQIHMYTQYSGMAVMALGLLFAMGELKGFDFKSLHSRIGLAALLLASWQPCNAYMRPAKPAPGERPSRSRMLWQLTHHYSGRIALLLGGAALMSGILQLRVMDGVDTTSMGLEVALGVWLCCVLAFVALQEYRRRESTTGAGVYHDWAKVGQQVTTTDPESEALESEQADLLQAQREAISQRNGHGGGPLGFYGRKKVAWQVALDGQLKDLQWVGADDKVVFAVTDNGHLWRSTDGGTTWSDQVKEGKLEGAMDRPESKGPYEAGPGVETLLPHPGDPSKIFLQGSADTHWISRDRGQTYTKVQGPAGYIGFVTIRMHPTETDWMLVIAKRWDCWSKVSAAHPSNCGDDLFVTLDFGENWQNLTLAAQGRILGFTDFDWAYHVERLLRGPSLTKNSGLPSQGLAKSIIATVFENRKDVRYWYGRARVMGGLLGWSPYLDFVRSDDFFASKHVTVVSGGNQLEFVGDLLFLAVSGKRGQEVRLKISADRGFSFTDACFPVPLAQKGYSVVDVNPSAAFVHVDYGDTGGKDGGAVLVSDSSFTLFTWAMAHVGRSQLSAAVDFAPVQGLPGVYIANQLIGDQGSRAAATQEDTDEEEPEPSEIQIAKSKTLITFDNGATWDDIRAPKRDCKGKSIDCNPDKGCFLHLHGSSSWGAAGFAFVYSHKSTPGIILSTGNVGQYLFEDNVGPTKEILYSLDEGLSWQNFTIPKHQDVTVYNIRVEPDNAGRKFLVQGLAAVTSDDLGFGDEEALDGDIERQPVILPLDFETSKDFYALCGRSDYEMWSLTTDRCLLGRNISMERQVRESKCWNGNSYSRPDPIWQPCPCSRSDFQCDYGYMHNMANESSQGSLDCVPVPWLKDIEENCPILARGDYHYGKTHERLVPGDNCTHAVVDAGSYTNVGDSRGKSGSSWLIWLLVLFGFLAAAFAGLVVAANRGLLPDSWLQRFPYAENLRYRNLRGNFESLADDFGLAGGEDVYNEELYKH
eukprot:SM000163S02313  [mRNA]  locus=s163:117559:130545:+ [translate_table: standard]